jgi:hypothetical protein
MEKAPITSASHYAIVFECCYAGRGADNNPGFYMDRMQGHDGVIRFPTYKLHQGVSNYLTADGVIGGLTADPDYFMYNFNYPMH